LARFMGRAARGARGVGVPGQTRGGGVGGAPPPAASDEEFDLNMDKDLNFVVKGSHNLFSDQLRARLDRFNHLPRAEKGEQISAGMLRYGPYAMFALLPAFAWLQKIAYLGRTRRYPGRPHKYVEHLVYAAHIHTFLFLIVMVAILAPWTWLRWLLTAWVVYYLFRAKNRIYGGSRLGAVSRGLVVLIVYAVLFVVATFGLVAAAILVR
jgi:hypothetical protein